MGNTADVELKAEIPHLFPTLTNFHRYEHPSMPPSSRDVEQCRLDSPGDLRGDEVQFLTSLTLSIDAIKSLRRRLREEVCIL